MAFFAGNRLVDRTPEFLVEGVEPFAQGLVIGTVQKILDPMDKTREDSGNVLGPGFPIFPVPAFLDDLGEDCTGWQIEWREGQLGGTRPANLTINPIAAEDDPIGRRVIEVDLVNLGIEPVVV